MFTAAISKVEDVNIRNRGPNRICNNKTIINFKDIDSPVGSSQIYGNSNNSLSYSKENFYQPFNDKKSGVTNSGNFQPTIIVNNNERILSRSPNDAPLSRTVVLKGVNLRPSDDKFFFEQFCGRYGKVACIYLEKPNVSHFNIYVSWFDINCTKRAFEHIGYDLFNEAMIELFDVQYIIDMRDYPNNICTMKIITPVIYACLVGPSIYGEEYHKMQSAIYSLLASAGEISCFGLTKRYMNVRIFECGYFDISCSRRCVDSLDHSFLGSSCLLVDCEIASLADRIIQFGTSSPNSSTIIFNQSASATAKLQNYRDCESMFLKTGKQLESVLSGHISLEELESLKVTSARVASKNIIDLVRIHKGLDTRTTIMIRNIPNKINQKSLKCFIDCTNEFTYEFLYLRIDFSSNCNVGYAFISFTKPEHIIDFAKFRVGRKWNFFGSEKYCDISYANIQGLECLIEKFRNSNVMAQPQEYRPKIYYTSGELKGRERPFPKSNNELRHERALPSNDS
ncbi:hypothetical protein DASC09_059390 [Saccharomycopsis crataegensis]|uniref:Mei2-like C-terminal RNA recognition motif domain-containing protein n=1 Tax=Saccharomycopsis crataegensis TaxID=43959 RepID=A0AAV5QWQ9_9ASCO|nr:hypothetical protein DASC09_059390 [Saccharomycopsis crataegensis]